MKKITGIVVLMIICISIFGQHYQILNESLKGSKIVIVEPVDWNKKVLIYAHGYRVEDSPLHAEIPIDNHLNGKLALEGWLVASTSYRRNGMIIRDAMEDIEDLRMYLSEKYGTPAEIYLYGISMGGKVVTHFAEIEKSVYTGVFALGAALECQDARNPLQLKNQLSIPILFISNKNEIKGPKEYIKKAKVLAKEPVLWTINRGGHCNISDPENEEAFYALLKYVKTSKIKKNKTILHNVKLEESEARFGGNTIFVKATGNFNLKFRINEDDLIRIGLKKGKYFEFGYLNKSYKVYWGDTYSDVPEKCWVGFIEANGGFKIARNNANAQKIINSPANEEVFIQPLSWKERKHNTEAEKLAGEAWGLVLKGDYINAEKTALEALSLDPENSTAIVNLTHCYLLNNEYDKAVKLAHKFKDSRLEYGQLYYKEAILEDLNELVKQGINCPDYERFWEDLRK